MRLPSQKLLKELFDYQDGHLICKKNISRNFPIGSKFGFIDKSVEYPGYLRGTIRIDNGMKKTYFVNHLIYIWHHGDNENVLSVKYIDCDKRNNHIENLEPCSRKYEKLF